jgi:hypothetical protein
MTLLTSSHSKKLKIQLVLLIFVSLILYCIYTTSSNIPSIEPLENTTIVNTAPHINDTPTENTIPSKEEEKVLEELEQVQDQAETQVEVQVEETEEEEEEEEEEVIENICSTGRVLRNIDPNHTNAHFHFWEHLTDTTIQTYKRRWQKFVSSVKRSKMPSSKMKGRGIVFVAGNKDTFQRAITSIRLLRKYKCTLNIEVWHLNDEQPTDEIRHNLEALEALPRDLSDPTLVRPMIGRRDAEKQ